MSSFPPAIAPDTTGTTHRQAIAAAHAITRWTPDHTERRLLAEALGLVGYEGHDNTEHGGRRARAVWRVPAHEEGT